MFRICRLSVKKTVSGYEQGEKAIPTAKKIAQLPSDDLIPERTWCVDQIQVLPFAVGDDSQRGRSDDQCVEPPGEL